MVTSASFMLNSSGMSWLLSNSPGFADVPSQTHHHAVAMQSDHWTASGLAREGPVFCRVRQPPAHSHKVLLHRMVRRSFYLHVARTRRNTVVLRAAANQNSLNRWHCLPQNGRRFFWLPGHGCIHRDSENRCMCTPNDRRDRRSRGRFLKDWLSLEIPNTLSL